MKIVIEIDDARFKDIQRIASVQLENYHFKTAEQIIANGTPLPDGAEILTIDKRTLKAVTGRFVIYDREWLKEHFNTTEAYLYGGTRAADVPDTNAEDFKQAVLDAVMTECSLIVFDSNGNLTFAGERIIEAIKRVPSVEPEKCGDCVSRQAAIDVVEKWFNKIQLNGDICCDGIRSLPSVEPEGKKGKWIPVSERLPEDLEPVNITWMNHNPESYYADIKDKPFTATGVYFNGEWYWWSTLCTDMLAEYSHNYSDIIDDDIEITAWMPLPKPYKAESEDKA